MFALKSRDPLLVYSSDTLVNGSYAILCQCTVACGSSAQDFEEEPDWEARNQHRIGFLNRRNRRPGPTHAETVLFRSRPERLEVLMPLQMRKKNSS